MEKTLKMITLILAALVLIGATFLVTYTVMEKRIDAMEELLDQMLDSLSVPQSKVAEVESYLNEFFVDDYDDGALADAAAAAMVNATGDRWSYYLSADEYDAYQERVDNAYVGIGITITEHPELGGLLIESVTPGGPAEEAGVLVGDILVKVEGVSTVELGSEETKNRVRGEEGTEVTLTFSRDGEEYVRTITRRSIEIKVAQDEMLDGDIGYIVIENFDSRCAQETVDAMQRMMQAGAKGLIFDVRFNGGGYKNEMVQILDEILPKGVIFRSVDYTGKTVEDVSEASCIELPMAVLVNEDSYSAAEFFAAVLQEYDWATVVGTKTCGKGNYQQAFHLKDGSLLNISTGKYYLPSGASLTDVGVTPDVIVELDEQQYAELYYGLLEKEDDLQLQAAIQAVAEKIS